MAGWRFQRATRLGAPVPPVRLDVDWWPIQRGTRPEQPSNDVASEEQKAAENECPSDEIGKSGGCVREMVAVPGDFPDAAWANARAIMPATTAQERARATS